MKVKIKEGLDVEICGDELWINGTYLCDLNKAEMKYFDEVELTLEDIEVGQKFTWGKGEISFTKLKDGYLREDYQFKEDLGSTYLGGLRIAE